MPLITAVNAREFAAKGLAARRANAIKRKGRLAALEAALAERIAASPAPPEYVAVQLGRTRKQIDLLNERLEQPDLDWKAAKALADAKARLYEVESALANRPKPGQFRPREPRQATIPLQPASIALVESVAPQAKPGNADQASS